MHLQPQTVHQRRLTEITEIAAIINITIKPEVETKTRSALCIQNAKILYLAKKLI